MKKAIIYSAAVCALSWAFYYIGLAIFGESITDNGLGRTAIESLYMFFPLITALLMQFITKEKPSSTGLLSIKVSGTWVCGICVTLGAVLLSIIINPVIPGITLKIGAEQLISIRGLEGEMADIARQQLEGIPPLALIASTLISSIIAGCTINAVFAFGEEYGWRNYLLSCLKGKQFWVAALYIGIVWGIWHAPLILDGHNYLQHPVFGVVMMCIFCLLVGIVELYYVLRTRSAILAAMMHGCINAISGLAIICLEGGNDLTAGFTGLGGFMALAIIIAIIWINDTYLTKQRIMSSPILKD